MRNATSSSMKEEIERKLDKKIIQKNDVIYLFDYNKNVKLQIQFYCNEKKFFFFIKLSKKQRSNAIRFIKLLIDIDKKNI